MRLVPARYWDGVYLPVQEPLLPNPRRLSSLLAGGPSGVPSMRNQTVLSLFFGKCTELHSQRSANCRWPEAAFNWFYRKYQVYSCK